MHELLGHGFMFAPAVRPALLRHRATDIGATNIAGVRGWIGDVADIGSAAVAHDVSPADFRDNAQPQTKLLKICLERPGSSGRSQRSFMKELRSPNGRQSV